MKINEQNKDNLKLLPCDPKRCESMCCYDGVYLNEIEEQYLVELVEKHPALKAVLPAQFIVDGYWKDEYFGRKTAVRPHTYLHPKFPAHFEHTRCVFADEEGWCRLEKLAREQGKHPWKHKPTACWMFPLAFVDGKVVLPSLDVAPNTEAACTEMITSCGRHHDQGLPWKEALGSQLTFLDALGK